MNVVIPPLAREYALRWLELRQADHFSAALRSMQRSRRSALLSGPSSRGKRANITMRTSFIVTEASPRRSVERPSTPVSCNAFPSNLSGSRAYGPLLILQASRYCEYRTGIWTISQRHAVIWKTLEVCGRHEPWRKWQGLHLRSASLV